MVIHAYSGETEHGLFCNSMLAHDPTAVAGDITYNPASLVVLLLLYGIIFWWQKLGTYITATNVLMQLCKLSLKE